MIVTIPDYKKISSKKNILNESLFDDDLLGDDNDISQDVMSQTTVHYEKDVLSPKVEKVLKFLDVLNYVIKATGHGIVVDVKDNLYLPNKGLNNMNLSFKFGTVHGSCNFTGNNLTDWSVFPEVIIGNCYANFNNIKDFKGAPKIIGKLIANKQNKKPKYPLTQNNYNEYNSGRLTENSIYAIPCNRFGFLYSICEEDNSCIVKYNDGTKQKLNLNEVEYLGNIENLIL